MIQVLDRAVAAVAANVGLSPDPFKIIVSLLLSYPLAGLLKRIPDKQPQLKNLYIIAVSLFFLVGLFDLWSGIRTMLISSLGTYLLAKYYRSPYMPWLNFLFIIGHLSINQVYRQLFGNDEIIDITGAQMVAVMKLTGFAWNIQDGRVAKKAKDGKESLSDFQRECVLDELPDIVSYLAWVFFFPALFIGPAFEYSQYKAWLDCSLFEVDVAKNPKVAAKFKKGRKIPKSGTPAAKRAIEGLFWLGCFAYLDSYYRVSYVLSDQFVKQSLLYRMWYIVPLAFTHRVKYYGVWKLSEGGCILAGFGFKGIDSKGRLDWTAIENISPKEFESAQNTKALLEAWNKNTNKWLKNYVYLRVTPKGKKPGFISTLATFITSAIWHGFYPGYYFAFATGAFAQTMGKYYRRNFRPYFMKDDMKTPGANKYIYDIITWVVTQYTWAYIVQPFVVLSFFGSFKFWYRYFFIIHVGMAINLAFFKSPGGYILRRQIKAKGKRYEDYQKKLKEAEANESHVTTIPGGNAQVEAEIEEAKTEAMKLVDEKIASMKS